MSLKDPDNTNKRVSDTNQDGMVQPPPPSYASSTGANTSGANAKYSPPTTESFYQAQPVGGSSGTQQYAPPAGVPYSPPAGPPPSTGYAPPSQPNPNIHYIPAPTPGQTVVYVVDDGRNQAVDSMGRGPGIPVAMVCFIFGLCTWVGYLFGMCFMNSKDPRERWWARMCAIMCIIWSLIIIFAAIFGRH